MMRTADIHETFQLFPMPYNIMYIYFKRKGLWTMSKGHNYITEWA